MKDDFKNEMVPKINPLKTNPTAPSHRIDAPVPLKRFSAAGPLAFSPMKDDLTSLREAASVVQRIRLSAQHELELTRKSRVDAVKYQQEMATKARSEAQQIVFHARLSTQREIQELIRKASEDIQKVLADIRMIRITAQEELAAQRKFTDAARISSISLAIKGGYEKPDVKNAVKHEVKKKKQLTAAKS
jgi:hypothetical protein